MSKTVIEQYEQASGRTAGEMIEALKTFPEDAVVTEVEECGFYSFDQPSSFYIKAERKIGS